MAEMRPLAQYSRVTCFSVYVWGGVLNLKSRQDLHHYKCTVWTKWVVSGARNMFRVICSAVDHLLLISRGGLIKPI